MIFGFLVFPGLEELDLIGPWEMISFWSKFARGPESCLMVAEKPGPVICAKGLSLNPHATFADCPPLDFLLVPGGEGTRREVDNPDLIQFVSSRAKGCRAVLSVCTGSFIPHPARPLLAVVFFAFCAKQPNNTVLLLIDIYNFTMNSSP